MDRVKLINKATSNTYRRPPAMSIGAKSVASTALAILLVATAFSPEAAGQALEPSVVDPNLAVRTVVSGLAQPISVAFLGPNDMLVAEKASGQVKRVIDGVVESVVLDLAVNSASERGLLSIALHPDFREKPWVYAYWTESSTGADTTVTADVPLLGNRVDRFFWNGSTLAFVDNLIRLRAFQQDAGQPLRGNHNGGVIRFDHRGGPDDGTSDHEARLFIIIGDNGRRGQTQNLLDGPFGPGMTDDQFGGPEPDDAHMTGVILRLAEDGSAPDDNPFYAVGVAMGGEVGANLTRIYSYGRRNSFGMAVDPVSGDLWIQENGDDTFDEINLVEPGTNGGWVQVMGPISRIAQFKAIELERGPLGGELQQVRWPAANIADTPAEALARLVMFPGARYSDPQFSWKYAVAPAGIGFLSSRALGPQYENDLFVGAARTTLANGYLFHFNLTGNRRKIGVEDARLEDRVADNAAKFDITESEELLFGRDFGIGTDIQTGPNGNLFVVSLSRGAVYEIYRSKVHR